MRRLSSIIILLVISTGLFAQKSPHGDDFALGCDDCHQSDSWKIDFKNLTFNHGTTKFPLEGQHLTVSCRQCHKSLTFKQAGKECNDCHTDMHNQSVGPDCSRCHTTQNWMVNNISEIHQRSRFPLTGAHQAADCYACHKNASANLLNWGPMSTQCIDCHSDDYNSARNPDHKNSNFPTSCTDCHNISSYSWSGAGINHNFFPLTSGHENVACASCHKTSDYSSTSPVCASCHQSNYNATTNPNHGSLEFSTDCKQCHTTNPGWKPAEYRDHDTKSFPIYSGSHFGQWITCGDCHPNSASYSQFTCTNCHDHNKTSMDEEHNGVQGYAYNDPACLACHPDGSKQGFDHNLKYPLTGAHLAVKCSECHITGYPNTPNVCSGCHIGNYNQSQNPPHATISVPTTCEDCHTTVPGWKPATFNIHNNYWVIEGAHVAVAADCFKCHQGNYTTTPNQCFGCHAANFNQTNNPNHISSGFPTTCSTCHSQTAWTPATFNHNSIWPLTGYHLTIAQNCNACHNGNYVNTPNTCVGCHQTNYNQTNNPNHTAAQFPVTCSDCHNTTAWSPANWNHDSQYFPIYSGKHNGQWTTCVECHTNPSNYAVFSCIDCHEHNAASTNSAHQGVSGYAYNSVACYNCHPNGSGGKSLVNPHRNE